MACPWATVTVTSSRPSVSRVRRTAPEATITGAAAPQAITDLDTSVMAGKTLLDATNAVTESGDLVYPNSSLVEHPQAALPAVHVVKSLNKYWSPAVVRRQGHPVGGVAPAVAVRGHDPFASSAATAASASALAGSTGGTTGTAISPPSESKRLMSRGSM